MSSTVAQAANEGGRAFKPGPRWAFAAALVVAVALAAALVLVLNPGAVKSRYPAQDLTYGSLPSWLPKSARDPAAEAPQYERATASKPVLDEQQGYTVQAELPGGSALVTAVGPQVPSYVASYAQQGLWPGTKLAPTTFDLTFAKVTGTIPISSSAFSVLTDTGRVIPASSIAVQGGGKVPSVLRPGRIVTLEVTSKALAGQGSIRWSPGGPKVLVGWVFQLELD